MTRNVEQLRERFDYESWPVQPMSWREVCDTVAYLLDRLEHVEYQPQLPGVCWEDYETPVLRK